MTESATPSASPAPSTFDPESYRMTLGDHLEELRGRLIKALLGFAVAAALCLVFGKTVVSYFCKPLTDVLLQYELNPSLLFTDVSEPFMIYIQISMICACVLASPWIVYQFWQFVAAGLYPHERKTITRYVPLSLSLLIVGDVFVYKLILPWTLQFFIYFGVTIPITQDSGTVSPTTQAATIMQVPSLAGNPADPPNLSLWFDTVQQRLKFVVDGKVRSITFGSENLLAPMITLPNYIDLVLNMLVVFGLSFQLPLIVLALCKIGVVEVDQLRSLRKVVYFVMAIVACVITPGDAITATVGLMLPLCLLFELGIWLAARAEKADAERLA